MLGSGNHRRVCALVAVLSLLTGMTTTGLPGPGACKVCGPTCPMHTRHIGCHHADTPTSHGGGRACVVRACGHTIEAAPPSWLRATLVPVLQARAPLVAHRVVPPAVPRLTAPLLEPPTDPPRALFVPV